MVERKEASCEVSFWLDYVPHFRTSINRVHRYLTTHKAVSLRHTKAQSPIHSDLLVTDRSTSTVTSATNLRSHPAWTQNSVEAARASARTLSSSGDASSPWTVSQHRWSESKWQISSLFQLLGQEKWAAVLPSLCFTSNLLRLTVQSVSRLRRKEHPGSWSLRFLRKAR